MVSPENHNANRLAQCGLKRTKQRLAILDIFSGSEQPLPAEEVFLKMKENRIAVNLSTVYRTLETMVEKGLLTKIDFSGDNRMLYEYNRMVHRHYLICVSCKKIIAVHHCPLKPMKNPWRRKRTIPSPGIALISTAIAPSAAPAVLRHSKERTPI